MLLRQPIDRRSLKGAALRRCPSFAASAVDTSSAHRIALICCCFSTTKSRSLLNQVIHVALIMAALCNRTDHYIFALWFLLFSIFLFFSSPNLSRRRLDVCHTSAHGVALVRTSDTGLKRAARGSLKIQDAKKSPKSPSGHHRTTLSGYIFETKACINNGEKTVKQQYVLQMSRNMMNFGLLAAEIGLPVWAPQLISTAFAS